MCLTNNQWGAAKRAKQRVTLGLQAALERGVPDHPDPDTWMTKAVKEVSAKQGIQLEPSPSLVFALMQECGGFRDKVNELVQEHGPYHSQHL